MGVYFIVLRNKTCGDIYAFTDSSGMLHVFQSSQGLSSTFLGLAARSQLGPQDLYLGNIITLGMLFEHLEQHLTLELHQRPIVPSQLALWAPPVRCHCLRRARTLPEKAHWVER